MITAQQAIAQLDLLLNQYIDLERRAKYPDLSDLKVEGNVLAHRILAAIDRFTAPGSTYAKQANMHRHEARFRTRSLVAIATALRADLQDGWLQSVVELVHRDTHSDFLEMAEELLSKGYKDAAAVIAGSSLEVHLKSLCAKHGVDTEVNGRPKKADTINADLAKAGAYGKLEQKQITAWLGVRNAAAHGEHDKYDANDAGHLTRGIRDFMVKYPA